MHGAGIFGYIRCAFKVIATGKAAKFENNEGAVGTTSLRILPTANSIYAGEEVDVSVEMFTRTWGLHGVSTDVREYKYGMLAQHVATSLKPLQY